MASRDVPHEDLDPASPDDVDAVRRVLVDHWAADGMEAFCRRVMDESPDPTLREEAKVALGRYAYMRYDYPEADRLVSVWADYTRRDGPLKEWLAFPNFDDLRSSSTSLESLAAYGRWNPTMVGSGDPEQVTGAQVTEGMFSEVLQTTPLAGRLFESEEYAVGGPRAILLSHGFWQRAFGGTPTALGTFTNNGATVNLTGTFDLGGSTFQLNGSTGSWNLLGGTMQNGTLTQTLKLKRRVVVEQNTDRIEAAYSA